jgi:xanthine dehydrogenase accessory factor
LENKPDRFPKPVRLIINLELLFLNSLKHHFMANHSVYQLLTTLIKQNTPCVLATVIEASGSTPQVPGSSAIIGKSGLLTGTVGGGPAEYKVVCKAMSALESGVSEVITFELDGNLPEGSDSICGGQMTVLIDASPEKHRTVFDNLSAARHQHTPGILITFVEKKDYNHININRIWFNNTASFNLTESNSTLLTPHILQALSQPSNTTFRRIAFTDGPLEQGSFACLETILPPPTLIIAGAGHVGKALVGIGKFLGFEVSVWDDRSEYANPVNIPEADHHYSCILDDLPAQIVINQYSYLVIVTRGHQFDAEVLRKWILTKPAYLGMMGSRTKVAQMRQLFLEQGWATTEEWDSIHTPIGLKIGAKTVEEIAISIAAELIQVKNQRD